jgi:hypothetical protein
MKRLIFLFITIVVLSGCGTQTYSSKDFANSTSMYTTQITSEITSTTQITRETQLGTGEITKKESTTKPDTEEVTVYVTKTGEKYHKGSCRYLSKSKIPINLSEAVANGYGACSICAPPVIKTEPKVAESTSGQSEKSEKKEITVYITKTGSKYHNAGCRYLSKSSIPISLSNAKSSYSPCSVCNPAR